jgi:citrate synthase
MRGLSIPELQEKCQKAPNGKEPLPESVYYLLLTGKVPTDEELKDLQTELKKGNKLTKEEKDFILGLPGDLHPMTMLSMCLLYQQKDSAFAKSYSEGKIKKTEYWSPYYDDATALLAKIPSWAAAIYRKKYHGGKLVESDDRLDWAGNYAHMMGFDKA